MSPPRYKKIIDRLALGAEYEQAGVHVTKDWRYDLISDYLKLSPSYESVSQALQGRAPRYPLPADFAVVEAVVKDFGDVYRKTREFDWWWEERGMKLYGIRAAPNTKIIGTLDSATPELSEKWEGFDSVIASIPLNLTLPQALKQLRKQLNGLPFATALPPAIAPKYHLSNSKISIDTVLLGKRALEFYRRGFPLWQIGNALKLVPNSTFDTKAYTNANMDQYSDKKAVLSIAARRLVLRAALIAENLARGRYPCDKPFKEAILTPYKRKAGRPKGSSKSDKK